MFGDLEWPLNASRDLSAIAEFLVKQQAGTESICLDGDLNVCNK